MDVAVLTELIEAKDPSVMFLGTVTATSMGYFFLKPPEMSDEKFLLADFVVPLAEWFEDRQAEASERMCKATFACFGRLTIHDGWDLAATRTMCQYVFCASALSEPDETGLRPLGTIGSSLRLLGTIGTFGTGGTFGTMGTGGTTPSASDTSTTTTGTNASGTGTNASGTGTNASGTSSSTMTSGASSSTMTSTLTSTSTSSSTSTLTSTSSSTSTSLSASTSANASTSGDSRSGAAIAETFANGLASANSALALVQKVRVWARQCLRVGFARLRRRLLLPCGYCGRVPHAGFPNGQPGGIPFIPGKEHAPLMMCGGGCGTGYCDRRCQRAHWNNAGNSGGHKDVCKVKSSRRTPSDKGEAGHKGSDAVI